MGQIAEILESWKGGKHDYKGAELAIKKLIRKIGGEYINEREAEVFLAGEINENKKVIRKGYWTGLAEGAKELLRHINKA